MNALLTKKGLQEIGTQFLYLVTEPSSDGAEFTLALTASISAIVMAMPLPPLIDIPGFRIASSIACHWGFSQHPRWFWSFLFGLLGFMQTSSLLLGSSYPDWTRHWRRWGLVFGAGFWGMFAFIIFMCLPSSVTWVLSASLCVSSAKWYWNMRDGNNVRFQLMESLRKNRDLNATVELLSNFITRKQLDEIYDKAPILQLKESREGKRTRATDVKK